MFCFILHKNPNWTVVPLPRDDLLLLFFYFFNTVFHVAQANVNLKSFCSTSCILVLQECTTMSGSYVFHKMIGGFFRGRLGE